MFSILPHESIETGPLPDDLMAGYYAAFKIAQIADLLSHEHLSQMPDGAFHILHRHLAALAIGDWEEVFNSLTANVQELNCARSCPMSYMNIVYPNAHLVCGEIWDRLVFHAWNLAGQLGLPRGDCCIDRWKPEIFKLSAFKAHHGRDIRNYFCNLGFPRSQHLLAELQMEISKVAQRRRDIQGPRATCAASAGRQGMSAEKAKSPMTVEQANDKAQKLIREFRQAFFAMSKRQQASHIGCHYRTWEQTETYRLFSENGHLKPPKQRGPKTRSLTSSLESVTGEGQPGEILEHMAEHEPQGVGEAQKAQVDQWRRLLAEDRDNEPSPLTEDLPGRERKVYSRKRL